jgi:hypothetical protein
MYYEKRQNVFEGTFYLQRAPVLKHSKTFKERNQIFIGQLMFRDEFNVCHSLSPLFMHVIPLFLGTSISLQDIVFGMLGESMLNRLLRC